MGHICKFCGKPGLRYDYNKDGEACLMNSDTNVPHSCKELRKLNMDRFFHVPGIISNEPAIDRIMRDYVEETRIRMPEYNAFDYDTTDKP